MLIKQTIFLSFGGEDRKPDHNKYNTLIFIFHFNLF